MSAFRKVTGTDAPAVQTRKRCRAAGPHAAALARYSKQDQVQGVIPRVSQETLAEMIGTTRSRVNYFMNKFRKMGLIKYDGGA